MGKNAKVFVFKTILFRLRGLQLADATVSHPRKETPLTCCRFVIASVLGSVGAIANSPIGLAATKVLEMQPAVSTAPNQTHSALTLASNYDASGVYFRGSIQTVKQLRQGSPPNPWECGWVVWNYTDKDHFYYLALKPNGWELGKRDPLYPGGQRFLATGPQVFPIGKWTTFSISQHGFAIQVGLNGEQIVTFLDTASPYQSGKLGVYTEDALVAVESVSNPARDNFDWYPQQTITVDGSTVINWTFPFLGYGSASFKNLSGLGGLDVMFAG